jgi:hypothetical protein
MCGYSLSLSSFSSRVSSVCSARRLRTCIGRVAAAIWRFKSFAPYALIELILPGGSVIALLLWLYRRRKEGLDVRGFSTRLMSSLRLADPLHNQGAVCGIRSGIDS